MTTDELRARFEAWYVHQFYDDMVGVPEWSEDNGTYREFSDHIAWSAYQAAHASRDGEIETLRKDAKIGRFVLKYAAWIRDGDDTLMEIRFSGHVDLSSVGCRRDAAKILAGWLGEEVAK